MAVAMMDWPDSDRGVFAISIAAELSGLHPQTLRIYEREGLIEPDRSDGGTRRYSGSDVEKIRDIAELTGAGVNLPGVKVILELQAEVRLLKGEIERLDKRLQQHGVKQK
jgi:MerR family transcriptional regulator, heat shock protein HspR